MTFTSLDFETANNERTSACSIGVSTFKDGALVKTDYFLIRPEPFHFNYHNILVHGIRPEMVEDAPDFRELWPRLAPLLQGKLLVAHNAPFDMLVLQSLFRWYRLEVEPMQFVCTVSLSRAVWGRHQRYSLGPLCNRLGIPIEHHHAGSDAEGAGYVLLQQLQDTNSPSVEALAETYGYRLGTVCDRTYDGFKRKN